MRQFKEKCEDCEKLCVPYDSETHFGCEDPEAPEPLDPLFYCKRCSKKNEKMWLEKLKDKNNWRYGSWQKSNAEIKAAKKLKLKWVESGGIGILSSPIWRDQYQYIPEKEYEELINLPCYGFCHLCGRRNKGGSCINKRCFERKERYKADTEHKISPDDIPF